jgi:hypothetical protein
MLEKNPLEQGNENPSDTVRDWQAQQTRKLEPAKPAHDEPKRVRLRLDVPAWLREKTIRVSDAEDTSISQIGAFLLAYALQLYEDRDPALIELLQNLKTFARSLQWGHAIDLTDLTEQGSER